MAAPVTNERVLSTLNADGSRNWIRPRLSKGRFLRRRRIVAYLLIALFTVIPFITINGKPAILLDILSRRFTFFGFTFLPTDTLLFALFLISTFITIFLLTALFGRVWCGWACPQTVYMEFLYRPIERFFEGGPGVKPKIGGPSGVRKALKLGAFFLCAFYLANTFLAYFVGVENLREWVFGSPFEHPVAFTVVAIVTGLMLFDFGFFREQVCIVACPYGRFQSVLLDDNSLIVSYDHKRGEPRGKLKRTRKTDSGDVHLDVMSEQQGDCIDCHKCVTTCPTGIDIRDGLQMECIGCTQCIDACDDVMDRIGKPRGLIRYSSQAIIDGRASHILRPRVVLYPALLAVFVTLFVVTLSNKSSADITFTRGLGRPFLVTEGGISNQLRVKITNRADEPRDFTLSIVDQPGAQLVMPDGNPITIDPGETKTANAIIIAPEGIFEDGNAEIIINVSNDHDLDYTRAYNLVGPSR